MTLNGWQRLWVVLSRRGCSLRVGQAAVLAAGLVAGIAIGAADQTAPDAGDARTITVDGRRVRVRSVTLPDRPGPTVVFESGLSLGLETWDGVIESVSAFAPVVAYDRPGIGGSDALAAPASPHAAARHLHAVLEGLHIRPPYVLVGHSWGGPLIRMFAGLHPDETAGLVYEDPTDLRTKDEDEAYRTALGYTPEAYARLRQERRLGIDRFTGVFRQEMTAALDVEDRYYAEFRTLPYPDVPVTVLVAARFAVQPWAGAPCQPRTCHDRWVAWRTAVLTALVAPSSAGELIVTTRAGHYIHQDDPALLVAAIQRVVRVARERVTPKHGRQ